MTKPEHHSVYLHAQDNTKLVGTLYLPEQTPHTALLINSGTGIPRGFYKAFARFAANQGFIVLTYDYRGIGDSLTTSLKSSTARYRDWGQQDVPAAIDYLCTHYPDLPLAVVGHSTGGQQLGLAYNVNRVKAACFVAVSTGYWAGMPAKMKWLTLCLWRAFVPVTTTLFGYVPTKAIGWGEDLPSGVAKEWGSWCLEPNYLAAFFDNTGHRRSVDQHPFGNTYFEQLSCPVTNYCFTDDDIATRANVPPLMRLFSHTSVEEKWISPQDLGQKHIGHLGLFRERIGASLWQGILDDLKAECHF